MFEKKDAPSKSIETIISKGVVIKGDIISQGSVRVDGQIEGTISAAGDLIIGESGKITGETKANNIILAGIVEGSLLTTERLSITSTGKMQGDINCQLLTIDEGGKLEGSTCMSGQAEIIKPEKPKLNAKA